MSHQAGNYERLRDETEEKPVRGWFPWPWPKPPQVTPEHPILLIPGICGTMLNARGVGQSGAGQRAWVAVESADASYRYLWGHYNSETGLLENLHKDYEVLIPTKDGDGGLFAVDILDPEVYVTLSSLCYFHNLIRTLQKWGYKPAELLFGFGYDFRQSNTRHVDALMAKLQHMQRLNNGKRVDVITHSMGGLIMKSFMALHPQEYEQCVRSWVALGAPFNGAPGFTMEALLTGVQFASGWSEHFFVERSTVRNQCIQSPSLHEITGNPTFHWQPAPPTATVWLSSGTHTNVQDVQKLTFSLQEFPVLLDQVLQGNEVEIDGAKIPMAMNPGCWKRAADTRALCATARVPATCQFYNIYGTGLMTAFDVSYGSEATPLTSMMEVGDRLASYTYVDGDGTVPSQCALYDGLRAVERVGVMAGHRQLMELPEVWNMLRKWLVETPPDDDCTLRRAVRGAKLFLGTDIEVEGGWLII